MCVRWYPSKRWRMCWKWYGRRQVWNQNSGFDSSVAYSEMIWHRLDGDFFLDPRKHLLFVYCCSLLVSCVNCYIDFQVIMIWPASVWLISVSGNPAVHHILHLLLITWPSNHITQVFIPHCFHFVSWPLADYPWLFVEVFTCWLSGITCSVLCHVTWLPAQSSTVTPSESVHCILKWLYDVHLASFLLQFVPIFCVKI